MTDERYLTVDQVAERLQVDQETVRRMLRTGRLAGTQPISRRAGWRVPSSQVERMLEGGRPAALVMTETPTERRAVLLANLRGQAERARARGDEDGAAQFDAMAEALEP